MFKKNTLLVFLSLLLLSGCSLFSSNEVPDGGSLEDALIGSQTQQLESGVELVWEIPVEPVTKYHLYFGDTPETLALHRTVMVSDLERLQHERFGPVFRYVVTGLAKKCGIYVSIEAENKAGKSPKTEAQELRCR